MKPNNHFSLSYLEAHPMDAARTLEKLPAPTSARRVTRRRQRSATASMRVGVSGTTCHSEEWLIARLSCRRSRRPAP